MKVQLYLDGEGLKEAKIIEFDSEMKISGIAKEFEKITGLQSSGKSDVACFLDDDEVELDQSLTIELAKLKKRSHVHCHRCKKVKVVVVYNGKEEAFDFGPNTKAEKVFKKSVKKFDITKSDASNLVLRLESGQGEILQDDDRIGSFVSHSTCHLTLYLTPKKQVQG